METHASIETLVERVEHYAKANIELHKLKTIDKSAEVVASLTTKISLIVFFILFFLVLTIAVALWVGDLLGKTYLGFFIVTGFYALLGILFYVFRKSWIKTPVKNSIISHALNEM